ncbi:MAG: hypothetical protein WBD40_15455 [Tepidisphaeraceae bacterium]
MIQTLSILGLVIAVALPILDYVVFRPRRATFANGVVLRGVQRLIYLAFLIALIGLALSGIASLAFGERMHGWLLILHMTLAPLFSVCVAGLALLWAEQARLTRDPADVTGFRTGETIAFWLVIATSFVTILSAMLGMMSWFGSDAQEILLNLHRISAIILTVAAAYQAGRLLPQPARPASV